MFKLLQKLKQKKAFTLVEVLVVLGVVSILFAIVFTASNVGHQKALDTSAKVEINSYILALKNLGTEELEYSGDLDKLAADINAQLDPSMRVQVKDGKLWSESDDPWGNQYQFTHAIPDNTKGAVIVTSYGKDGVPHTKDDITITVMIDISTGIERVVASDVTGGEGHVHIYEQKEMVREGNCTQLEMRNYKCAECGFVEQREMPGTATGHDFRIKDTSPTYLKDPATCIEYNIYYYKCSRCPEKDTNFYKHEAGGKDPLNHDGGTRKTDSESGQTSVHKIYCDGCNKLLSTITVTGYTGIYDENDHGISVSYSNTAEKNTPPTITYSTTAGGTYSASKPTYSDVGTYTTYYKVEQDDMVTVSGSQTVSISKAENTLQLSAYSGELTYPVTGTFNISVNKSNGEPSVSSSNGSVCTASISENTVTLTPGTTAGTAVITVTSEATHNYKAKSTTYNVTVKNGTMTVSHSGYTGAYNNTNRYISVSCSNPTDAVITYATSKNGTYSTTNPGYKTVGTYTVWYKVVRAGYITVNDSETIKITNATQTLTPSETSGSLMYPSTGSYTVTTNVSDAVKNTINATVLSNNTSVCQASVTVDKSTKKATVKLTPGTTAGTATITLTMTADNYESATATYTFTNNAPALAITTQPTNVNVANNGNVNISLAASGVELKYQWYLKDIGGSSFAKASSTSTSYSTTMNGTSAGRQVYCIVTDAYGQTVQSNTVTMYNTSLESLVSASGYSAAYDGQSHGISVSCSGGTISYGTSDGNYTLTSSPTYKNIGTNTVYYQVSKPGYITITGSKTVVITKSSNSLSLSSASGTVNHNKSGSFTATTTFGGTLSVSSSNSAICSASVSGSTITLTPGNSTGTATITVTSSSSSDYSSASKTYTVTVGHTYDQKDTATTYRKSVATCQSPAVYYYSCVCDAKTTSSTFTSGSKNASNHTNICPGGCGECLDCSECECCDHWFTGGTCQTLQSCYYCGKTGDNYGSHSYDSSTDYASDCREKDVTTYVCEYCDDTYTSTGSSGPCSYNSSTDYASDCRENDVTTYTCRYCGDSYTSTGSSGPCSYTSSTDYASDCREYDVTTYTCRYCGDSYTETGSRGDHDYEEVDSGGGDDCETRYWTDYECIYCGDPDTSYGGYGDHDWSLDSTDYASDCTEYDQEHYSCDVCGKTKTETGSRGPCLWEEVDSGGGDDCETRYWTDYECSGGHTKTSYGGYGDHDWSWDSTDYASDCSEYDQEHYTCDVCGDTKTETGSRGDHDYFLDDQTWSGCYYTSYYQCSVCSDTYTESGYDHDYCSVCGACLNCDDCDSSLHACEKCGHEDCICCPVCDDFPCTCAPECSEAGCSNEADCGGGCGYCTGHCQCG